MRSILFATALAFSALVPATLRTADACGGGGVSLTNYPVQSWRPSLHAVSTHSLKGEKTASFILLDRRLPSKAAAKLRFARLDPMSYDKTSTAPGEKLARPMVFTLVGPAGTKVIKATQFTWVDVAFEHDSPRVGIPVEGDYRIALDGERRDVSWEQLSQMNGSTVTVFTGAGTQFMSSHGSGSTNIGNTGRFVDGYPLGIVHISNTPFVVMSSSTKRNVLTAEVF